MEQYEWMEKEAFCVIGREGSTADGQGFVAALWADANAHFEQVEALAKRDASGGLVGLWGLMSDMERTFAPWQEDYSQGLYLAGVEVDADAQAPEGWSKWTAPASQYLRVAVEGDGPATFRAALDYLKAHDITLAGAVYDFTDPAQGKSYMVFPTKRL